LHGQAQACHQLSIPRLGRKLREEWISGDHRTGKVSSIGLFETGQCFLRRAEAQRDHVVGIPDLWLTGWVQSRRNRPWEVFGPSGTIAMMNALKLAFSVDIKARVEETAGLVLAAGAEISAHEIEPGLVYERDGLRVSAMRVDHRAVAPAYGYRIDYSGRSVVLSGDTSVSPNLVNAAAGTQLLIHEIFQASDALLKDNAAFARVKTFHVDASEAGSVFQRVHPKLAVYSHIILIGVSIDDVVKQTRTTYSGPLVVGEDLMRFVVGNDVAVTGGDRHVHGRDRNQQRRVDGKK
jgi:ribonuclease Z